MNTQPGGHLNLGGSSLESSIGLKTAEKNQAGCRVGLHVKIQAHSIQRLMDDECVENDEGEGLASMEGVNLERHNKL